MILRRLRQAFVPVMLTALVAAAAAHAQAEAPSGGTEAPDMTGGTAAASDGSFSLAARSHALLGRTARFRGNVPAEKAGRTVTVQRYDAKAAQWVATATTTVASDGTFVARWRTDHIGRFRIRAYVDVPADSAQTASSASPEIAVTVYKPAVATWYGPGFYGNRTACGQRLTRALLGVAHRTLPCGTPVAVFYNGATVVVPVVDRGPFRAGTTWDLTSATAKALGFTVTDTLGAVRMLAA
jgi:rare lipoprotein A (peptidoglycan hydrolase)